MKTATSWTIGLIGYGEVGRILAEDLCAQGLAVCAYDIKLNKADTAVELSIHATELGVALLGSHAEVARNCELVISAVTASQTLLVAQAVAPGMLPGAYFLDLSSASPSAMQQAANLIERVGGKYVECAVMTSVLPHRIKVPLLLGGRYADELASHISLLGCVTKVASEKLGVAAATKMCRSVMTKGMEATLIESFTAARFYGVEDAVVASLQESFPGIDWEKQAAYIFQRVIEHGRRRGEEMREVADTVCEVGLAPWISSGTAECQAWVADLADAGLFGTRGSPEFAQNADWRVEADRLLAHLKHEGNTPLPRR